MTSELAKEQPTPRSDRPVRWLVGLIALAAAAALFWPRGQATEAPGGFLIDGLGQPAPLGSRLAPVTLLHFWATWCPPCIVEIPALARLRTDLAGRPGFAVVMVAVADDRQKAQSFVSARPEDLLLDPNWDVAHRYGTRQLPETYLIVRGKVVERFVGTTDWDDPEVRKRILAQLSAKGGDAK